MIKKLLLFLLFTLSFGGFSLQSALAYEDQEIIGEYISSYNSGVTLEKDGSMTVVETISVAAANIKINHGIYRDFPTVYNASWGFKRRVPFDIVTIKRDGKNEPYHIEYVSNGTRVFIGDSDVTIPPGRYIYEITYKTNRQVGFFTKYDELYWNVNGNGWEFPVANISTTVTLPSEVQLSDISVKGFTGEQGSTEEAVRFSKSVIDGKPTVYMEADRSLKRNEGLTFVINFPKGIVSEPNIVQKQMYFLGDNILIFLGFLATLALIIFYPIAWYLHGRDKGRRVEVPRYEPVKGISAGASRHLSQMGYDTKTLTATLVEIAVKGYIKISEVSDKYSIELVGNNKESLSSEQQELADFIFSSGTRSFTFDQSNHTRVSMIINKYSSILQKSFSKHFSNNLLFVGIGILITAVYMLFTGLDLLRNGEIGILFIVAFLGIWDFVLISALKQTVTAGFKDTMKILSAVFLVIFIIPSFVITVALGVLSIDYLSILGIISLICHFVFHLIFISAMKARSKLGSETQNHIDGFRRYLSLAEKERIKFFNKELPKDIKTYEKYLPYAIAFDIETQWTQEFKETIDKAKIDGYEPSWYSGYHTGFYSSNFGSSFATSFSNVVSAASVDPTSSSGSGGGGSSGGGGGGGGGGGW